MKGSMDPDVVRALIEGHEDIITPAAQRDQELRDTVPCPACGNKGADLVVPSPTPDSSSPFGVRTAAFSAGRPNIQGAARCRECQCTFDPVSRVITKMDAPVLTAVGPLDPG